MPPATLGVSTTIPTAYAIRDDNTFTFTRTGTGTTADGSFTVTVDAGGLHEAGTSATGTLFAAHVSYARGDGSRTSATPAVLPGARNASSTQALAWAGGTSCVVVEPEALVVVPLLTAAYLLAVRQQAPWWRIACFLGAMALHRRERHVRAHLGMHFLLTVHLLQNVVAEWAPLLVVLGIPPALAATLTRSSVARALTHPALALPLWLANYMLWHLPSTYDAALENQGCRSTSSTPATSRPECLVVERRAGRAPRARPGTRAGTPSRRSSWEA